MNCSSTTKASTTDVEPFFDLASDLMCILDERGRFVRVNQAFVQGLEYSAQFLRDRALTSLFHPEDSELVRAHLKLLSAATPTVSFTHRCLDRSRQVHWLEWTVSIVETDSNRAFYGVAKDITHYRSLQGELDQQVDALSLAAGYQSKSETVQHEQSAQLRVMFDQASVGIARISATGHWIQANQYLCDLLGYSAKALLDKTLIDLVHLDDKAAVRTLQDRLLSASNSASSKETQSDYAQGDIESRYITSDGSVIWALTKPSAIYNQQGELLYLIFVIQDITRRKEALRTLQSQKDSLLTANFMLTHTMQALEQRNAELDQFAYVTSHDLKAPLRAIANLATWIEEDLEGQLPEENIEQFELLKSRVHRMEGLINGLLAYSRVGRTHQSSEQVDVAKLLEAVIDSLPTNDFTIEIAPNMPQLQAKRVPLFQVFANLIGNAIMHHHRPSGTIKISAKDLGSTYQFTVADDGPGIDPAFHEKVFTIFQTLRARDELESTGIGLSIVKKTIVAEGGDIQILSQVGQGTAFQFTWPHQPNTDSAY